MKRSFFGLVALLLAAIVFMGCPPEDGGGGSTKTLSSITVTTLPTKTTYAIDEDLNLAGLVITATYSDDSTADISDTTIFSITDFNSSADAAQQDTVLSSIAVTTPPTRTIYTIGDRLNLAGLVITATYGGNQTVTVSYTEGGVTKTASFAVTIGSHDSTADISDTSKLSVTGFDSSEEAVDQRVTISYTENGITKTATFIVIIRGKILSSIAVTTPPTKTIYTIDEILHLDGLMITATYSDDSTVNISDTSKFSITGFNSSAEAVNQTVTVSYTESSVTKTASFFVTISNDSKSPTVTSVTVSPSSTSVARGETQAFTATVSGTNSPAETVTWSVSGGANADTVISNIGVLSVAANESATVLTITATSTVDTTRSGMATVSVISFTGNVNIKVGFNYGEITITGSDGSNVISKSGTPASLTLSATGYTDVVWYVDADTNPSLSGNNVILNAGDYMAQRHSITFTGIYDGLWYSSQPIPFTVLP
jgi:roadblock/LC7 domain-containing protein